MPLEIFRDVISLMIRFFTAQIPIGYGFSISIVNVLIFGCVCFLVSKLIHSLID